jgi:leishmanolysin
VLALAACKGTEPFVPTPTSVLVTPASLSFSALGAQRQLSAAVLDQHGDAMKQATVSWSTGSATVASVSTTGLVTTVGNGTTQIVATAASAHGSVQVTVAQATRGFFKAAGDFQTGAVGAELPQPIAARVTDSLGTGIAGVPVTFAVTQGGGAVSSGTAVTTGTGIATVSWTLGTVAGAQQALTASIADGTLPALAFTASAIAGPAASVELQAGNGQTAPQGTALPVAPAVLVHDGYGNVKRGARVTFAVTGGGGVVTGALQNTDADGVAAVGGWSMGPAGPQALNATVSGTGVAGNPVGFTATSTAPGAPASVVAFVGDQQTGLAGFALNVPPGVVVRDAAGNPVGGVGVSFAVSSGGGSLIGENAVTAVNGVAQVGSWSVTLGNNSLTATAAPAGLAGNPVTLTGTGVTAQFHIDIRYLKPTSPSRMQAFTDAAARWEQLIYGDVPDITVDPATVPAGSCGSGSPALNETIDDLVIFVVLDSIDGPRKILGQAGPCFIRVPGYLPLIGLMRFDTADVANLENAGQFDEVILHEMGHVLGFGTIWEPLGLLADPASAGGTDPHFVGPQAVGAFDRISAPQYTAGAKVPVENIGGGGTIDSHWRESVFGTELMTGFLNGGVANPLSVVTVASMGDLAYTVNYAGADPFSLVFALRASGGAAQSFGDDILKLPIRVVDRSGRIVRVVRP